MFKYIRQNSDIIVKFLLTHIVMSLLGIMVGLAVLTIENNNSGFSMIAVISSLFTIGFMCFMHYDDSFFCGVKEGIKCRADGTKPDLYKGLKIALIAFLPVILLGLAIIVIDLIYIIKGELPFAYFGGNYELPSELTITTFIYYFFQGSFLPLYALQQHAGIIGYVLVSLIFPMLSSTLGYAIGAQDKTIRGMLGMNVKPPFDGPLERKPKNKNNRY